MAELQTLARPYARAAFSVARDQQALPAWDEALSTLAQASQDETLAALISHPNVEADVLVSMLLELAKAADIKGVDNLLKVLAENRRLSVLPAVAEEFSALRQAYEQTRNVEVTSATELAAAQQQAFSDALKQRLGVDVSVSWAVNADLVGGAVVSAGDLVIDGSVRGEIDRLRSVLTQ